MSYQACEITTQAAIAQSTEVARALLAIARRSEGAHWPGQPRTHRFRVSTAKTWCYHTVVATPAEPSALTQAADFFYRAACLPAQPWYPQFLYGQGQALTEAAGGMRHQLTLGVFDVGLIKPRAYRQLVSHCMDVASSVQVVALRSVMDDRLRWPTGAVPAYALDPTGDVLEYRNGHLLWHHICTTPGAGVLPMPFDRWLINAVRFLGLDRAERNTYHAEARAWANWVSAGFNMSSELHNTQGV
ncbi:MAG TPA: hypothetical protein VIM96_02405 [Pseudomonadales bacterium]